MANYSMNTIVHPEAPYEIFWECCELNELQWSEKRFVTLKEYTNNIAADNQGPALKEKENGCEEMVNDWALGCPE